MFLVMPVLGAMADHSAAKKCFLTAFASGFAAGNVFYDGFLPDISTPDTIDKVSAKGYAIG